MHQAAVAARRALARLRPDQWRRAGQAAVARLTPTPRPDDSPAAGGVRRVTVARRSDADRRPDLPAAGSSRRLGAYRHAGRLIDRAGGPERALPIGIAGLVLVASILSVAPATGTTSPSAGPATGGIGNTYGAGVEPRLAVGGDSGYAGLDAADIAPAAADGPNGYLEAPPGTPSAAGETMDPAVLADIRAEEAAASQRPDGPYLADGTLLKPVAVDTSVPDGSGKLRSYAVRSGDTLTGIASRFGVSMMTVWWANDLNSKDSLHVGQKLVIPPVSGVVVKVKAGDTLASIAAATRSTPDEIVSYNGLTDPSVVLGQVLVIPGGRGDAIPTPKPKPAPAANSNAGGNSSGSKSGGGTSGRSSAVPPARYGGGRLAWPVPGGYISQYFHYGHWAIDIAADTGTPVLAAAAGTVIFAGWKNNGGGYQVWISHGSNLYTTYNHMSAVTVGVGQSVGRGHQVGRVGMTGDATGPHCHFEVWIGAIWDGGSRVNPLRYL